MVPEIEEDLSGSVDKNGRGDDSPVNPDEEENDHGDAAEGEEGVQQQRAHERHLRKNLSTRGISKNKFRTKVAVEA
jgi:hypothetical protein